MRYDDKIEYGHVSIFEHDSYDNVEIAVPVTEAISVNNLQENHIYWTTDFPFREKYRGASNTKRRPVVVLRDPEGKLKLFMISSVKSSDGRQKYSSNCELADWIEEGLKEKSFFNGLVYRKPTDVTIASHWGVLTSKDLKECNRCIKIGEEYWYKNPFAFQDWLKSNYAKWRTHPTRNMYNHKFQDHAEIKTSKEITPAEVANIVHLASNECKCDNSIVYAQWVKDDKYSGKEWIFPILETISGWWILHFNPNESDVSMLQYRSVRHDAIKTIETYLHNEIEPIYDIDSRFKLYLAEVSGDFVNYWDTCVKNKVVQNELLDLLRFKSIIPKLNENLNKYGWACVINGKVIKDPTIIDWVKRYKVLSPNIFEAGKVGCCFDYVVYQQYWFKKHFPNIKTKTYYAEGNSSQSKSGNTHIWMTFSLPYTSKVFSFESSDKAYRGIKAHNNEEEMLAEFHMHLANGFNGYKGVVYEVKDPLEHNLGCLEFMKFCIKHGELVKKYGNYFEEITKPWIESNFKYYPELG